MLLPKTNPKPNWRNPNSKPEELQSYIEELERKGCTRCLLGPKPVISRGNIHSPIMIAGQNPGKQEVIEGKPFVGRSGKSLEKWLEFTDLNIYQPYITNIGLCPTKDNRPLNRDEQEACSIHFKKQLEYLQPLVIIAVGLPALKGILNDYSVKGSEAITKSYLIETSCKKVVVRYIWHPSYIFRNMGRQAELLEQNQTVLEEVKELVHNLVEITKAEPVF